MARVMNCYIKGINEREVGGKSINGLLTPNLWRSQAPRLAKSVCIFIVDLYFDDQVVALQCFQLFRLSFNQQYSVNGSCVEPSKK